MKKQWKRALCLLLTAALFCTALPVWTSAARYSDVPAGAWYAAAAEEMAQRGIMAGTAPNTFNPGGTLTRAEFATMISKCELNDSELREYDYKSRFTDVSNGHWAKKSINWANAAGIVSGTGGGKFSPSGRLTRQDIALMVARFVKVTGQQLPAISGPMMFLDQNEISGYAKESVLLCQQGGVMSSRGNMKFEPKGTVTRAEAAVILSNMLKYLRSSGFKIVHKRMIATSFVAVEVDPSQFSASVAMGGDRSKGGESVRSLVSRTGAKIAVNAAFFDMSSYEALGTIITDNRIITTFDAYAPYKSAITMDSSGKFSVENFRTQIYADVVSVSGDIQSAKALAVNRYPGKGDGTRLIFTSDWGGSLGFAADIAAVVDVNGQVTAVYRGQDVTIPKEGFVLALRAARNDGFEAALTVGAQVNLRVDYEGSSTQDIALSLGVGPKIVENGRPYGDRSTYNQEGFSQLDSGQNIRRVCIGVRDDGQLVILTAVGSLAEMSQIMVAMGCKSAVNLDGGGSANLYADGQWLYGPQDRLLNNMLYFK